MGRIPIFRKWSVMLLIAGAAWLGSGSAWAQVPVAPPTPACAWDPSSPLKQSNCWFKPTLSGTPTSLAGNRVILFTRALNGGHPDSRTYSENALKRLAALYGFTATVTDNPAIFTAANLANTKVVIMSNGDGDVIPPGANRNALQDFQQINGWGVIWIHAACAFITSGWPFGQQSCVQQFHKHDLSGTRRRVFIDSGTVANPNHGIKNPQTEFVMRSLPGFAANRTVSVEDEWYCFQAPARNTVGVNVLLGYDRSSGTPRDPACPSQTDAGITGSQMHNLAWTRSMGQGITIYNSIGHDEATYTANAGAGDSLLWRFIRYAAKDWEVKPTVGFHAEARPLLDQAAASGPLSLSFADGERNAVTVSDASGRRVFAKTFTGVRQAEIPSLPRGIYFVKVASRQSTDVKTVRLL